MIPWNENAASFFFWVFATFMLCSRWALGCTCTHTLFVFPKCKLNFEIIFNAVVQGKEIMTELKAGV